MKRVIIRPILSARGVQESYENIPPLKAIKEILRVEIMPHLNYAGRESNRALNIMAQRINAYKQSMQCDGGSDVDFHHFDKNTSNNFSDNVYLISKSAHGYLHISHVEELLIRVYELSDNPGFLQGPQVEQLLSDMYEQVKLSMRGKGSMENVVELLIRHSEVLNQDPEYISEILEKNSAQISVITKSDIVSIITSSGIDFSKPVDVTNIDDEVGSDVLDYHLYLEDKYSGSRMNMKSIRQIRKFIQNNSTSRQKLSDDYERGLWKHSGDA